MNEEQHLKNLYIERLNKLLDLLESNGLKPFLMCGTLLAYIREGKPFIHDYKDIDIALQKEDYWKFRKLIDKNKDFNYYRIWRREIAVFYKDYGKIDIFFLNSNPHEKVHVYSYKKNNFTGKWDSEWTIVFNGIDFYPLKRVEYKFLNRQVYIPKNPENVLQTHYGDWKIPNPNWSINDVINVDSSYRQLAFVIPQFLNTEDKAQCVTAIKNLYPENWYRIYFKIEDSKQEPILIILNNKYIFTKELDINAMIQVLLSNEEIGAVSNKIETEKRETISYISLVSRTQPSKKYIYDSSECDFLMIKREYLANKHAYKIAKIYNNE